ncbi:hypothetical protein DAPPUDRAFT_304741 [Daphnia pulex]|uniref:EF-hand domain-containing protein n=1 Tax=Daphnia pulex TaxID=6669 RepID=E9FUA5_DAPPU|nr:hypothetical protein DAPPUDRAFT_304741 [Daphnia pulex]|eukprot:EFX88955.1 hypothetical protein DAPPUDRAFT_304741 [Daphnia pulex]
MASTARNEREMILNAGKELSSTADPLERLRLQCLQRGVAGIRDFGRTFRIWDDDGNRKISYEEFVKGLSDFGASLTATEAQQLFHSMDKNSSGSIEYDELLIALRPPMSKSRISLILAAFQKMDKTGDGVITPEDLKGVYNVRSHPKFINGEKTEEQIFQEYLRTFDSPHGDGKVTLQEFEEYYAGVSASIDLDVYFDLMMRQAWKL